MKAECQDCGKRLKQLFWSKFLEPELHCQIIALEDFYYCQECNHVYRRKIQTEVLWYKLDSSTEKVKEEP